MSVQHLPSRAKRGVGDAALLSWAATVADLRSEAAYLADRLRQPLVRTAGAAGIVNRLSTSTVWVCADVDLDELLVELEGRDPAPEIMVPEHSTGLADALVDRGRTRNVIERLRCDLAAAHPSPSTGWRGTARLATPHDLPRLREIYGGAFPGLDSAALLPDEILDVAGLRLFVTAAPDAPDLVVGCAGVRLRHAGSLVFGLATEQRWQRQGVATSLVRRCLHWAATQRCEFAIADVDVEAPSHRLWERLGFTSSGKWHRCAVARQAG